ncbi:autotransporter outer membrane beta-barrel domain-containing protein [Bartonella raoultii]|uniref:autotransporter outer membrane beta-barrel domain-containing protein n=1 Tax=Bartonella raoultii TaxID=1457020 RepID=UPI001ABA8313|nr:autotransporter outer membrane beta-barrel domain-containing protein [Bartonella raoultii]
MKKNVLLYTVSSVLFYSSTSLSYAFYSPTPLPTIVSPSSQPAHAANKINTSEPFGSYKDSVAGLERRPPSSPPSTPSAPVLLITSGSTTITTPPIAVESTTSNPTGSVSSQAQSEENLKSNTNSTGEIPRSSTPPQPSKQPTTPKDSTGSSEAKIITKPEGSSKNEGIEPPKAKVREGTQSSPTVTQSDTAQSSSTGAKSRRRSGVPSYPTDSSSEKTPTNSTVYSQPEASQPSPSSRSISKTSETPKSVTERSSTPREQESRQQILLRPEADTQKVSENSAPIRPTAEPSSAAKGSELSSISLRPTAGQPTSQETSESVKPASVRSPSAQQISEKSELTPPISPIKQPENPSQIEDIEDISTGVEAKNGETVTLHDKKIQDRWNALNAEGKNSKIQMNGGSIDVGFIALSVLEGGEIDATDITVSAETAGLVNIEGTINLKDSSIQVTGSSEANGIIFRNNLYRSLQRRYPRNTERNANAIQKKIQEQDIIGKVNLDNTKLFVENGTGISLYGTNTNGVVSLKNSEINADTLLKNIKNENESTNTLTLVAEHSSLEGRVRTSEDNRTIFDLKEGTKWLLKPNKNSANNDHISEGDTISYDYRQFGLDEKSFSNLSVLRLTDSTIMFNKPMEGHYQTLFIGPQLPKEDGTAHTPAVYSATGVTEIYVNTQWNKHSPITEQKTDRIVINGDVSGNTIVHINLQETDKTITDSSVVWGEQMASLPLGTHGVSIIQVSGQANENSFTLAGDYMTIGGQPYKYILASYKPGTSHESQSLFDKKNAFWDFRLQNDYIDKDKKVRALLPQVANYLTLPNSLFSSGLADVNNQNRLLDAMRTTVFSAADHKQHNLFSSFYGEKVTLSSNRGPLRYGYDADVNYKALQLGAILATSESKDISAHFGLLGTYGKLAFTPKEMQDSEKTTLDKWSITAYSSLQHSNGLYIDTLLSYGRLKGNITTALVGNAAKLDGTEILNLSATLSQKLTTSTKGLVFEPQAQLIYQNLMFDIFSDANGLKVDMGNPHQWLIRFGGRLTKTIMADEESKAVSFYGKMNVIRTFGDGKTIKIADTFDLDPTGSSIEGGMGVNAYLSQNIVLNGDISYRQKLQKTGVSGTNVSGGIRYLF